MTRKLWAFIRKLFGSKESCDTKHLEISLNKYGYRVDQSGASKTKLCAELLGLVLTPLAKLAFFKQECLWDSTYFLAVS